MSLIKETNKIRDKRLREAQAHLGWAMFNLTKDNTFAAQALIVKAMDDLDMHLDGEITHGWDAFR